MPLDWTYPTPPPRAAVSAAGPKPLKSTSSADCIGLELARDSKAEAASERTNERTAGFSPSLFLCNNPATMLCSSYSTRGGGSLLSSLVAVAAPAAAASVSVVRPPAVRGVVRLLALGNCATITTALQRRRRRRRRSTRTSRGGREGSLASREGQRSAFCICPPRVAAGEARLSPITASGDGGVGGVGGSPGQKGEGEREREGGAVSRF